MAKTSIKETTTQNVPELVQLTVKEPAKFNNIIATDTETSTKLEKKISNLFAAVFEDYEGCKIISNPAIQGNLKVKLYFKPVMNKSEGGLYAVKVRGEGVATKTTKKPMLYEVVNTVNMLATSKQFELEDTAKELLSEFLIISDAKIVDRYSADLDKVVKVRLPKNWNAYVEEIVDPIQNTRFTNPYLAVTLDLLPIIAKIYGKKDEEEIKDFASKGAIPKDRYQYSVNIVKVLNATVGSYILEIRRIDTRALNELGQSIGYGTVSGNIVMTRK